MRIAYGTDTKSIEGWDQIAVIDVPDDLDAEELEGYLAEGDWTELDVVMWDDVLEALTLALASAGMDSHFIIDIALTVKDGVVNA